MRRALALVLGLCLICGGCGAPAAQSAPAAETGTAETVPAEAVFDREVFAMDTHMDLRAYGPRAEAALGQAAARIEEMDARLSVTGADSEIYALNHSGQASVSPDTADLLEKALTLSRELGGALQLTIYPVLRAWGFTTEEYRVPEPRELAELLEKVDDSRVRLEDGTVTVPQGTELDLGAVAKGYVGDLCADLLRQQGVTSALLNLGGSTIHTVGVKPDGAPWRIAIQDPEDPERYAGILELGEGAVNTSGGYERYFERDGEVYWHILDPATGYPAKNGLVSVTVLTPDSFTGDGLSTALFVMGREKAIEYWRAHGDFEFVLIDEDGAIWASQGAADRFTPQGRYENAELAVIARED